jgi:hypothetical protein
LIHVGVALIVSIVTSILLAGVCVFVIGLVFWPFVFAYWVVPPIVFYFAFREFGRITVGRATVVFSHNRRMPEMRKGKSAKLVTEEVFDMIRRIEDEWH